jgi:hypothetical protein
MLPLESAALPYWWRRVDGQIEATTTKPSGHGSLRWRSEILIKSGVALRGKVAPVSHGGYVVYKGENVSTAGFTGEPTYRNIDVSQASGPYVWGYPDIYPEQVYAIPMIEQVPVAAPFNPHEVAVLNTASVFAPRPEFRDVPFDMVMLSRVYSWFYAIACRSSFQNKQRTHIYPTSIARLPWSDDIALHAEELSTIRARLLNVCEQRFEADNRLRRDATNIGLEELRRIARRDPSATLARNESFSAEPDFILEVGVLRDEGERWVLPVSALGHEVTFASEQLARRALSGFRLKEGEQMTWPALLATPIPSTAEMTAQLEALIASFEQVALDTQIESEIDRLDAIIGQCLRLTEGDIAFIRHEMTSDPYLSKITPRYPYFRAKQRGRRLALERSDRYQSASRIDADPRIGAPTQSSD